MPTVLSIFGTRPEAIKMAPVVRELQRRSDSIRSLVCVTGQHREMLDQVLKIFAIQSDYDLNLMQPNQTLAALTAGLFEGLDRVVGETRPDWILAQDDTTTVMVASLVSHYHRMRFGHVEAGLRTGDKFRPFPEEMNRRIVSGYMADPKTRAEVRQFALKKYSLLAMVNAKALLDAGKLAAALRQIRGALRCNFSLKILRVTLALAPAIMRKTVKTIF